MQRSTCAALLLRCDHLQSSCSCVARERALGHLLLAAAYRGLALGAGARLDDGVAIGTITANPLNGLGHGSANFMLELTAGW